MRFLLMMSFALLVLAGCSKSDQKIAAVTPLPLPAFSCDDTSDDGKFELWDSTITRLVFDGNTLLRNPDTLVPGYIKSIDNADTSIIGSAPDFHFRAVYDTGFEWYWVFAVVNNTTASVEQWGAAGSDVFNKNRADTILESCDFQGNPIMPGCKRIYYYGFKPDSFYHSSRINPPGLVLFKGHFDVEVH